MSCHTWQVDQAPDHCDHQLHPGNGEGDGKLGPGVTWEMYHVQCWLHVTIVTCFVRVTRSGGRAQQYLGDTKLGRAADLAAILSQESRNVVAAILLEFFNFNINLHRYIQ